jgi:hypothetical protein
MNSLPAVRLTGREIDNRNIQLRAEMLRDETGIEQGDRDIRPAKYRG